MGGAWDGRSWQRLRSSEFGPGPSVVWAKEEMVVECMRRRCCFARHALPSMHLLALFAFVPLHLASYWPNSSDLHSFSTPQAGSNINRHHAVQRRRRPATPNATDTTVPRAAADDNSATFDKAGDSARGKIERFLHVLALRRLLAGPLLARVLLLPSLLQGLSHPQPAPTRQPVSECGLSSVPRRQA